MVGIVAVGGGQASFSFVQKLKALGHKGVITLVCSENTIPYQRPPLSKKFLLGDMKKEQLFLRPESYYQDNGINIIIGKQAVKLDINKRKIELEDGFKLPYKKLFLGTGSSPRKLPNKIINNAENVYYVRNIKDIQAISKQFNSKRSLLIIGGGYIGLEMAAVARKLGLEVTIIEAQERILKRVSSEVTASFFRNLHSKNGVRIRENVSVKDFIMERDHLKGVLTDKGENILADFFVVGIGIEPNVELAESAGLEIQNGIFVDDRCCTSDPNVFAAGDCANFPYQGERIRLESVGNAIEQSEVAANVILGNSSHYNALPWFWSDQFHVKLQIAGLNAGYTEVVERIDGERISHWYYRDGEFKSVDAINDPISYMVGKKLIERGQTPDPKNIRSVSFNVKSLLRG